MSRLSEKMLLLAAKLEEGFEEEQFTLSAKLEAEKRQNLKGLGYGS